MKTLVYAEKPDVGKNIVEVLEKKTGPFKKNAGYFENETYIVTWGIGHLLTAKLPSDYKEFKTQPKEGWCWEAIPFYPPGGELEYKRNESVVDQLRVVERLLKSKEVTLVVNACDAGREGELIFWSVFDYLGVKKPVKRLWISDLTPETILKGFDELKEEPFFRSKREAAYGRQFADWALGMNLTVAFTVKARSLATGKVTLHVGRVQTPTLAILVKRREEIENFKSEDYFEIEAEFGKKYKGLWFKEKIGNTRLENETEAKAIAEKIRGKRAIVTKKDVVEEKEEHKLLYNLVNLQREANSKFGFTSQKTLDIVQILYEKYKYTTYPRTDSEYLTTAMVPELEKTIQAVNQGEWAPFARHVLTTGIKTTGRIVDDKKVSDHHAIIPTKVKANISAIQSEKTKESGVIPAEDIRKIYDLIVKRFLSVFYPAALYEKTEIVTEVEKETFKTSGKILIRAGWKEVYGKEAEEEEEEIPKKGKKEEKTPVVKLPPIAKGEENPVTTSNLLSKKTQPPKHYTEGTLLGVMDNPRQFLEDKEMQKVLSERKAGLGTPATRSSIINNIVDRGYVEYKGKSIIATDLAKKLISIAPEELKSPIITADWEQKLHLVWEGKEHIEDFKEGIKDYVQRNIEVLKKAELEVKFTGTSSTSASSDNKKIGICPDCKKDVFEIKRKIKDKETGKDKLVTIFACASNNPEQVCFRVFDEKSGVKLTSKYIKQLLEKKRTEPITGFKSQKGTTFSAPLVWNSAEKKLDFDFEKPTTTDAEKVGCPFCKEGHITENKSAFGCSNFRSGCKFTIWKNDNKKINIKMVTDFIKKKEAKIAGFKNEKGEYSIFYELDLEKKEIKSKRLFS